MGTAFGMAQSLQNLGTSIAPLVGGAIIEGTREVRYGFYYLSMFYGGVSLTAFSLAVSLFTLD